MDNNNFFKKDKAALREFSREHLYYEIKMLFGVLQTLESKDFKAVNKYIFNALIESYVIHTNILLDFFYKPPTKPDDAKAVDYVKDRKKWKTALLPYNKYFRKFNRRRSREVVHLSYRRLEVSRQEKTWFPEKTTQHIKELINVFLDNADPELVHPRLYELKMDT